MPGMYPDPGRGVEMPSTGRRYERFRFLDVWFTEEELTVEIGQVYCV